MLKRIENRLSLLIHSKKINSQTCNAYGIEYLILTFKLRNVDCPATY